MSDLAEARHEAARSGNRSKLHPALKGIFIFYAILLSPAAGFFIKAEIGKEIFYLRTDESKFFGKTEAQVLKIMGKADEQAIFINGDKNLIYEGPSRSYCRIEIRNQFVANVVHWSG